MQLILTVMADDKPGIVERLSDVVVQHDGNWLDSRLAHMAGKFAGIIRIDSPQTQSLTVALQALKNEGIFVDCQLAEGKLNDAKAHCIEITGHDRLGIVKEVTACLANLQVNILDFHSSCYQAAMSSETMFKAKLHIELSDENIEQLESSLEALSSELVIDWIDE